MNRGGNNFIFEKFKSKKLELRFRQHPNVQKGRSCAVGYYGNGPHLYSHKNMHNIFLCSSSTPNPIKKEFTKKLQQVSRTS